MRTFVYVCANDYFGCGGAYGKFIKTNKKGDEGTAEAIYQALDEDIKQCYVESVHCEDCEEDCSPCPFEKEKPNAKKFLSWLKSHYSCDGGPQEFIFEVINGEMKRILP